MKSNTFPVLAGLLIMFTASLVALQSCAGSNTVAPAPKQVDNTSPAATTIPDSNFPSSPEGSPVAHHGLLQVRGRQVCDQSGKPVQLRGMSLFWSQWGGKFYNSEAIAATARDWKASVVRIAMGVEAGGYLSQPQAEIKRVKTALGAARSLGIYAIIDWHDHHASDHADQAEAFFRDMARSYKNDPGIIFEIYNEPLNTESWDSVKEYAQRIIAAIREEGAPQLILVGSPSWDQRLDWVAMDPITTDPNIAYTMHFYAASHGAALRRNTQMALDSGLAVFCSEWGSCDASGNSRFAPAATAEWLDWLDQNGISWCNWSLTDKNETASALNPGASAKGGWTDADLSPSGLLVKARLLAGDPDLSALEAFTMPQE